MKSKLLIMTLALVFGWTSAVHAAKIIAQPEDAVELALGEVSLPGSTAGTVIFKACSDCKTRALRVHNLTIYKVNGRTVRLEDFLKAAEEYRKQRGGAAKTAVYVYFDVESQRVNRLSLDYLG